jgi:hypothetical protein
MPDRSAPPRRPEPVPPSPLRLEPLAPIVPPSVPPPTTRDPAPSKEAPIEERKTLPAPPAVGLPVAKIEGEADGNPKAPFAWEPGIPLAAARSGPATLVLANGTRLSLTAGSALRLLAVQPPTVSLERGEVFCSVAPAAPGAKVPALSVRTASAEATVLGTQFAVALEGEATRVQVDEGAVRVIRPGDAQALTVRAGQLVLVGPGLPFARRIRPPNLLADPGFEGGGVGWRGFEGGPTPVGPDARVVAGAAHRGKAALRFGDAAPDNFSLGVAVEPGTAYEFEGWTMLPEGGAWAVTIVWLDATGNWKSWVKADDLGILAGPRGWTRWHGSLIAPPRARTAWIALNRVRPGTALFDDFRIAPIPR